jgi:hypothetical protein
LEAACEQSATAPVPFSARVLRKALPNCLHAVARHGVGAYVHSLVMTDISSAWTECAPLVVREKSVLIEALERVRVEAAARGLAVRPLCFRKYGKPRYWRTRIDPLEQVWSEMCVSLE